ncbi:MAG: hypothetical protein ABL993_07650 [Vicinamibacterales bacterium]
MHAHHDLAAEGQTSHRRLECDLHVRIQAEFIEMPGLKLTLSQAARLFGLDAGRCSQILVALVEDGVLIGNHGSFWRAGTGRCYT